MGEKNANWGGEFADDGITGAPPAATEFRSKAQHSGDRPDIPYMGFTTHQLNPYQARHGEPAYLGSE